MPANYSHYSFGQLVLKQLPIPIKKIIDDNIDLYNIGLHGPDILFYNRPIFHSKVNKLGSKIHDEPARVFFEKGIDIVRRDKSLGELAYLFGFICHFVLDSNCHYYVQEVMDKTGVSHFAVEAEFERYLLMKDHKDISKTLLADHVVINDNTINSILPFYDIKRGQLKEALTTMHFADKLFLGTNAFKRNLLITLFKISGTYNSFGGILIKKNGNEKVFPFLDKYDELYSKSIEDAVNTITDFSHCLNDNLPLTNRFDKDFH